MKTLKLPKLDLGLEWILILLGMKPFDEAPYDNPESQEEFNKQRSQLSGSHLQNVIREFEARLEDEKKRRDKLEAKAFSLISFTSLAGAVIAGLAQLALSNEADGSSVVYIGLIIVYIAIAVSLLMTIELARRATKVGPPYRFMEPLISNLWGVTDENKDEIYREHGAELLQSYFHNRGLINDKATYVIAAQDWFRNTIVLLFLLPILFSVQSFVGSSQTVTDSSTLAPTPAHISTPAQAVTDTSTVMPSPSAIQVTLTPRSP